MHSIICRYSGEPPSLTATLHGANHSGVLGSALYQLEQRRREYENAKQELVLAKRQLSEKDEVILQLKTAVRKLQETLANKEKDLQAMFAVLRAPQDAELTKSRRQELIERLLMDVQQRAAANEALAEERKQTLDKLRYSSKFLRFQELEVEIDECNAEIERLRQREATAAGKERNVIGRLRVTAVSVPPEVSAGSATSGRQRRPTLRSAIASNQAATDSARAALPPGGDPWSMPPPQTGYVRVVASADSTVEQAGLRESIVSKTRRRAIEADYYKQVRLAQLEAECELKENVRIRAAREARKMRFAAEQQRQQAEQSKARAALMSVTKPVESRRSSCGDKEHSAMAISGADAVPQSNIDRPAEDSEPDAADDYLYQPGVTKSTTDSEGNENNEFAGGDQSEQSTVDEVVTTPTLLGVSSGDHLREAHSAEVATAPATSFETENQGWQNLIPEIEKMKTGTSATTPVVEALSAGCLSSNAASTVSGVAEVDAPTTDRSVEAPGDQLTNGFDDDTSLLEASQIDQPDDTKALAEEPSAQPPAPATNDVALVFADKIKMYEDDEFDDGEADADTTEGICSAEARSSADACDADGPVTNSTQEEATDEISPRGVTTDEHIEVELNQSAPEDAAELSSTIQDFSLTECVTSELHSIEAVTHPAFDESVSDVLGGEERSHDTPSGARDVSVDGTADTVVDTAVEGEEDSQPVLAHLLEPTEDSQPEATTGDNAASEHHHQVVSDTASLTPQSEVNQLDDKPPDVVADGVVTTATPEGDSSHDHTEPSPDSEWESTNQVTYDGGDQTKPVTKQPCEDEEAEGLSDEGPPLERGEEASGDNLATATPVDDAANVERATEDDTDAHSSIVQPEPDEPRPDVDTVSGIDDISGLDPTLQDSSEPQEVALSSEPAQPTDSSSETPRALLHDGDAASTLREEESPVTARSAEDSGEVYTPEFASPRDDGADD